MSNSVERLNVLPVTLLRRKHPGKISQYKSFDMNFCRWVYPSNNHEQTHNSSSATVHWKIVSKVSLPECFVSDPKKVRFTLCMFLLPCDLYSNSMFIGSCVSSFKTLFSMYIIQVRSERNKYAYMTLFECGQPSSLHKWYTLVYISCWLFLFFYLPS